MNIKLLQRKTTAAFTIVEIAIALGVIGFALVAIVGVLPTGLNVEKENREETLINQDGPYFLEAVRGGSLGLGILTNFVDSITITEKSVNPDVITVYNNSGIVNTIGGTNYNGHMTNSAWIIGLLSRPKYLPLATNFVNLTNRVDVRVRALSGSAIEQKNVSKDVTFGYSIFAEIVPVNFHSFQGNTPGNTNVFDWNTDAFSRSLQANLYEVRLNFRWPLLPNGEVGNGRKIYRTYVSGQLVKVPPQDPADPDLYFFHTDNFAKLQ